MEFLFNANSEGTGMSLFEHRLSRIRCDTSEIASHADLLEHLGHDELISPAYDLRASAKNLREAADKLDAICKRGNVK